MGVLWLNRIKKGGIRDVIVHLIPAVIAISLFQVMSIEIYHNNSLDDSKINFFIWVISQAFGSYILGAASDRFCRKKTLIFTQVCGLFALLFLLIFGFDDWGAILFTGLIFSPSSVAKAALVDNFPMQSKVRMIGITFIALFLPWCFYFEIISINALYVLISSIAILVIDLLLTVCYFEDRRDRSALQNKNNERFVEKKRNTKTLLTYFALFPAQMIFFLSDSYFEQSPSNWSLDKFFRPHLSGIIQKPSCNLTNLLPILLALRFARRVPLLR